MGYAKRGGERVALVFQYYAIKTQNIKSHDPRHTLTTYPVRHQYNIIPYWMHMIYSAF